MNKMKILRQKHWLLPVLIFLSAIQLPQRGFSAAPVVDANEEYASETLDALDEEEIPLAKESVRKDTKLSNTVKGLQQEIHELRGQLEMQAGEMKRLQEQQLAFYKDIDKRINGNTASTPLSSQPLSQATPASTSAPYTLKTTTSNPAEEQIHYLAAFEFVRNKQYEDALNALHSFVETYPQGGYTANAQYWLGELYMIKKDYAKALQHFTTVTHTFPNSSKVADCNLKMGYALQALGRNAEAIQQFEQVIKNYPDTSMALLAANKKQSLRNT